MPVWRWGIGRGAETIAITGSPKAVFHQMRGECGPIAGPPDLNESVTACLCILRIPSRNPKGPVVDRPDLLSFSVGQVHIGSGNLLFQGSDVPPEQVDVIGGILGERSTAAQQ